MAAVAITPAFLKKHSGQFDLEGIYRLLLKGKGIKDASPIPSLCPNLTELDLAENAVSSTAGFTNLEHLAKLNLSANCLTRLEDLQGLPALEEVHLEDNNISSIKDIEALKVCPKLRVLYLQSFDGRKTNPCCSAPGYRKEMLKIFPNLENLDGERLQRESAQKYNYRDIEMPKGGSSDAALSSGIEIESWTLGFDWKAYQTNGGSTEVAVDELRAFRAERERCEKSLERAKGIQNAY